MTLDWQVWLDRLDPTLLWVGGTFALIATAALLVAMAVRKLLRDPIREQLAAMRSGQAAAPSAAAWTEAWAGQLALPAGERSRLEQDLRRAGYYAPTARSEFLAVRNSLTIGAVLMAGVVAVMVGPEHPQWTSKVLAVGVAVAGLAWALPRLWLSGQGKRRVARIGRSLPDALDLSSMCLAGGLSLHDTLAHVAREIVDVHPDLAVELLIVRQESQMTSLDRAVRHWAERIDAPDVLSLTAVLTQTQRLGTDVASALQEFADSARLARRQRADEIASRASVRLLFPLVLCLVPAAFILLWGPAALELRHFFATFTLPKIG